MPRKRLNDKLLSSLKPTGEQYDVWDAVVPCLSARVSGKGKVTLTVRMRFPAGRGVFHRAIGRWGTMTEHGLLTIERAREVANEWSGLVAKGLDPEKEAQRARAETEAADERKRAHTFRAAVDAYISTHQVGPDPQRPLKKKGHKVARQLRNEFVNDVTDEHGAVIRRGIGDTPIEQVALDEHIQPIITDAVARGAPYQAHILFGVIKAFFNWVVVRKKYKLAHSPCDRAKPKNVVGRKKKSRQRVLDDAEIAAYWRAAGKMQYPYGPFYRLLMLTGQRLLEIGHAEWREVLHLNGEWSDGALKSAEAPLLVVGEERMKGEDGERQPHSVPLPPAAAAILRAIPKYEGCRWVFAFRKNKPMNGWSKAKAELDRRMLLAMRAQARTRGEDWRSVELKPFVNHDVRRTVRTRLSSLRVPQVVCEQVIAHVQTGIHGVYDVHRFDVEKAEALGLWEAKLLSIVSPPPKNIVDFQLRQLEKA